MKNYDEGTYGKEYRNHILEQYKLYVEMADKISQRRLETNNFFVSVNTLLLAFFTQLSGWGREATVIISVNGEAACNFMINYNKNVLFMFTSNSYNRLTTVSLSNEGINDEELANIFSCVVSYLKDDMKMYDNKTLDGVIVSINQTLSPENVSTKNLTLNEIIDEVYDKMMGSSSIVS